MDWTENFGRKLGARFDNNEKGQFHCDGCGVCHIGGRENYKHCYSCGLCFDKHKCLGGASQEKCPFCLEFMRDSLKSFSR